MFDALDTASTNGVGSGAGMIETTGTPVSYIESNNSTDTQIKNTKPWSAATPATYADFTPQAGNYAINGGTSAGCTDYDNTITTPDFAVTGGTGNVAISGSTVTVDAGVTEFTLTIWTTA